MNVQHIISECLRYEHVLQIELYSATARQEVHYTKWCLGIFTSLQAKALRWPFQTRGRRTALSSLTLLRFSSLAKFWKMAARFWPSPFLTQWLKIKIGSTALGADHGRWPLQVDQGVQATGQLKRMFPCHYGIVVIQFSLGDKISCLGSCCADHKIIHQKTCLSSISECIYIRLLDTGTQLYFALQS